jgi:hypothetical protein
VAIIVGIVWLILCAFIPLFYYMTLLQEVGFYYSIALQILAPLVASGLCYYTLGAFAPRDPMRKVWGFLGSAVMAWGIGALLFALYPLLHEGAETPYPWYSDIGYLSMIPLAVTALLIFKQSLRIQAPLWGITLALALFAATVGFSAWLIGYGYAEAESTLLFVVDWTYIVLDPLLLGMTALTASVLAGGSAARPWWFVLVGLFAYFVGDIAYVHLTAAEVYATGHPIDISWPLGFGFIAMAAVMTREMFTVPASRRRASQAPQLPAKINPAGTAG